MKNFRLVSAFALCALALIGIPVAVYAAAGATALPIASNPTTWTSLGAGPIVVRVKSGAVMANATAANCTNAGNVASVEVRSGDTAGTPFYTSYVVCVKGTASIVIEPTAQP